MERDYLQSNQCRLSTTKEEFLKANFAFVAAKGSPLASIFNRKLDFQNFICIHIDDWLIYMYCLQRIMMMSESGLIQHWKEIHWPNIKKCKQAQRIQMRANSEPKKLSLKDLQGSFFIWSIGSSLALVTFSIEFIMARKSLDH